MFCPVCGRAMAAPPNSRVPFPMFICANDGIIYDQKRTAWYGVPEIEGRLHCPACGSAMDSEPKVPPVRIFFCYQCGTTYDRTRSLWYGLAYHHPSGP